MKALLIVALGGACGAVCRWGLGSWIDGLTTRSAFPWGIFIANVLGCFLFGLLFSIGESRAWMTDQAKLLIFTGFLGSLTTFSTFGWNTLQLIKDGQINTALMNILLSVVVGIAGVWLGYQLGKTFATA